MTQDLMPLGNAVAAERMSTVEIELHGSLAGGCAPGNTVTCVGLVKVLKTETATGDVGDGKKALFLLYVEANSISLGADLTQYVAPDARARAACCGSLITKPSLVPGFSTKDLTFIIKFHEEFQGRQFAHLVQFLCPAVPGYGLVKAGLVLALLGGVEKPDGASHFRGALHVLLCGSAGTPQNELLQAVAHASPRSQTIDGSSPGAAGGLLGAVKKDSVTADYLAEAGPLAAANHGVCCIQHLEKLTVHHAALQEAVQAGHLAVSKHGVSACLPAQTAIVAVASPAGGQLAAAKTLQENVKLAPSFLASFDLIYELKDQQSMHTDTGGRHEESASESEPGARLPLEQQLQACASATANPVPVQLLRKYIAYAQTYVTPVPSAEAKEALQSFYLRARREGSRTVAGLDPDLRVLETLIRIAEARARADLRQEVTLADAEDAIELVQFSLFAGSPEEAAMRDFRPAGSRRTSKQARSEAKRFLVALEKRCQLAVTSEVSVAQLHALGININLSVPDMDAFIDQLNDAGAPLLLVPSMR
ncbi:g3873 [Coccomyxa viridis]|uniref:DNA helicase n=1 Tax=Coccomyxa viridis TaxID=1274662 RepID=A0ABP1FRR6_9CHLO